MPRQSHERDPRSQVPPGDRRMIHERRIEIPRLVRIKPGVLDRVGVYLQRERIRRTALLVSDGLPTEIIECVVNSLSRNDIECVFQSPIIEASVEECHRIRSEQLSEFDCLIGLGGGKALDASKFIGCLHRVPTIVVPTSLSNDGFCSPQSSLTAAGRRTSLPSMMPCGLIIDTQVCLNAPRELWASGVGDLVSKITAVKDWRLASEKTNVSMEDFAALLSDSSVFQFMARPEFDLKGMKLLATALMLNGVAMAVAGSSRPASGGEHLISHAFDAISATPRLHGLQVGIATYLLSFLHGEGTDEITRLFNRTGFWDAVRSAPFSRRDWAEAVKLAPSIKEDYYTILSERDQTDRLMEIVDTDPMLRGCFDE